MNFPLKAMSLSAFTTLIGGIAWLTTLHNNVDAHTHALEEIKTTQFRNSEVLERKMEKIGAQISRLDAKVQLLIEHRVR